MKPRCRSCISKAMVLGIFVGSWGCGDVDADERSIDTGDGASDSTEDRSTDTDRDSAPPGFLGDEAPEISYEGFEDRYILTDDDDPIDVCRVRYTLRAVAKPAVPCTICEWEAVLERQDPEVLINVGNACENSELHLDGATVVAAEGEQVAYGFARESVGHADILMRFNVASGRWEEFTISNWEPALSTFRYKRRDGMCTYSGAGETDPSLGICGISGEATITALVDDAGE